MTVRSKIQLGILVPALVLLTASALLLFSALHNFGVAEQRLVDDRTDQARRTLGFLKEEIEHYVSQPEFIANAQRLLMSQSIDKSIAALAIIAPSGQILANRFTQDAAEKNHRFPFTNAPRELSTGQNLAKISLAADSQSLQAYIALSPDLLPTQRPEDGQTLLYASYDLSVEKALLWQQIRQDFQIIWLFTSVFVLTLALVFAHFVTRPLAKLVEFSQQLTNGHAGRQSHDIYLGELATLNQALNTLSSKMARTLLDLNAQQENLEVTLYAIGDAVITTNARGRVSRMNPIAEQLTGWYAYEARGKALSSVFSIIDADTREVIANPVDKVLATGKTHSSSDHTTLIAKDGSEHQIANSATPMRNANDKIEGMVLAFKDVTEEVQLRQAARNIQQQIQALFDDMQTMAGFTTTDGSVTFMNNTPLIIGGIEAGDVLGKKLWDCPWFDHDTAIQEAVHADCIAAASGEQTQRDILINTAEGELMWVQFSIHPVVNEQGRIVQLLAEGHNISPRKKAEEALSASLQRIKLYREQTPLATIEWDRNLKIIDWNNAASNIFGYALDEVKGHDASIIMSETPASDENHIWQRLIQQAGTETNSRHNITKNGRRILCEWHNSSIVDQGGKVVGITSLVLDITAEHEAKLALIEKEKEQREILNTLTQGIITVDETGEILSINPAVEEIFGYSNKELIGKDLSTIMPAFDADKIDQYMAHYGNTGATTTLDDDREALGLRKNKTTFPLHATAAELPLAADGTRRFISSCYDLTASRLQEKHLQRTQKMDALGKIVGGVAHDYNNMLGVILGYADLIAVKFKTVKGLNKYIDNIAQAGERGRTLTERMLTFAKQEGSQPEVIELHSLLAEQNELLGKALTVQIKLDYQFCETPWPMWLDPQELEDTLLNLAINAKEAMPDGGELTLATHKRHLPFTEARALGLAEGDYMELSVAANGCGIREEIQGKIFDPFFTTKGSGGTGLGLSQAYNFMDRSGGAIYVESHPGLGTRFSLYFPRYEGAVAHPAAAIEKPTPPTVSAGTILIVDDEPALREVTREILSFAGYQVFIASDGDTALSLLANQPIDLMISDIIMPSMSGYDLAKIVTEKYPAIKIQLASGYSNEQSMADDQEQLHRNILRKPFRSAELLNSVAELLGAQGDDL